jgi:hypothetical protein
MIAWDIDGVFTSDLIYVDDRLEHLLHFRHNHIRPIFEPSGAFYLITGRPVEDKPHTLNWIEQFWENKPLKVFHDNPNIKRASDYKLSVLLSNPDIDTFVESSELQIRMINKGLQKAQRHIKVIHFASFIRMAISSGRSMSSYEVLP